MYAAKHYMRIGRRHYTPGEIIEDGLTTEQEQWLLASGAIYTFAPEPEPAPVKAAPAPEDPVVVEPEADEVYEEDEAPEIDAMAGIVTEAPKKKPRGKRKGGNA